MTRSVRKLFAITMAACAKFVWLTVTPACKVFICYTNSSNNCSAMVRRLCVCRLREMVLRWLPVSSNSALEGQTPGTGDSPIKTVLRSKGFMWMSHSHTTAFYWSHAGQHFEIRDEGDW